MNYKMRLTCKKNPEFKHTLLKVLRKFRKNFARSHDRETVTFRNSVALFRVLFPTLLCTAQLLTFHCNFSTVELCGQTMSGAKL